MVERKKKKTVANKEKDGKQYEEDPQKGLLPSFIVNVPAFLFLAKNVLLLYRWW